LFMPLPIVRVLRFPSWALACHMHQGRHDEAASDLGLAV
jgi:hypothetical protein